MRILFIADGRSPIALSWLFYFLDRGDEVHLASTFECTPSEKFASVNIVPVAFSQLKKGGNSISSPGEKTGIFWGSSFVNLRTSIRRLIFPLTIPNSSKQLWKIINNINPDLVHALRIPFEGMLAAQALQRESNIPFVISVWGNDFTLHAGTTPWMRRHTRLALDRTDGLHTDCQRDLNLAYQWGFSKQKPTLVVPGNGGIRIDLFYPSNEQVNADKRIVINPRGVRSYIRNDTFFAAIPGILANHPNTKFVCPGMAGDPDVIKWIDNYGIGDAVELLPNQSRHEIAEWFRRAEIAVSPSTHDGTPNTLLEAMACGCYPVAGDLDSIREWIKPGDNGSLIDPSNPQELTEAVSSALANPGMRQRAAEINQEIIEERAEYISSMARAVEFYKQVIGR